MSNNGYIKINYYGGYGNNLFMYFMAKLYGEKHNLILITEMKNNYIKIKKNIIDENNNFEEDLKIYTLRDKDFNNYTSELPYYGKGIYIFDGFFQYEEFFYLNKQRILNMVIDKYKTEDYFSIHVRLGDYYLPNNRHLIINSDYYIDCIKKYGENYKKIYIICDKLNDRWEKLYMFKLISKIKLINKIPIYRQQTLKEDINSLIKSRYIVTSNSTLCFWATFFSNAEKIITFPYFGIDVKRNKKIVIWNNNPQIFKYNKNKNIFFNDNYSKNIIDFFENMIL
jgi:hypothetical protein